MPFVALALFTPAALAATDIQGAPGLPGHAPAPRSARAKPGRRAARPFSAVSTLAHAAGAWIDPLLVLAHTRTQLVSRDPVRAFGDGPRLLRAKLMAVVPGARAKILSDGYAAAPADAPSAVQQAIWAANQLIGLPYEYGGGHGSFLAGGYDCSGSVSFALHGGGLLTAPDDSSEFFGWGRAGRGRWLTVYTSAGHAFLEIAGIRLDTSSAGDPSGLQGPRWRPLLSSPAGYVARHPLGY
jgi:cell wall-associated NlpC family hydrolase